MKGNEGGRPPGTGKGHVKPVSQAGPRPKLDPRLAAALSLPPEVIEEIRRSEGRHVEARLEELRKRIEAAKDSCDHTENPDFVLDEKDPRSVKGVPRQVRARLLQYASFLHGLHLEAKPDPTADVFLKFRGDINRFGSMGVRIRSVAGDIATATVPLRAIPQLEADEDVLFIELSRPAFPTLDQSVPLIEADHLHTAPTPVQGQGTIVGLVDYGIDFYHPDFRDPTTNNTRLLSLWDQTPPGTPGTAGTVPAPWGYGLEYTAADIDNELAGATPYSVVNHRAGVAAHGTHVAGIAAGNGQGDGLHIGVAPQAGIIFVDTVGSGVLALADMTQVSDAADYIFTRAGVTPCSINMSIGDNLGPHDGTSLVEQFIDNLLTLSGRSVAIAAGNANNDSKHAAGTVPNGGTLNVTVNVQAGVTAGETIELWYDGLDRFDLTLTPPGMAALGPYVAGSGTSTASVGGTTVTVTSTLNDPRNGDNVILIILQPPGGGGIPAGAWQLQLSGNSGGSPSVINGLWQAWIDRNSGAGVTWAAPTAGSLTLGTPGTCRRVITVASHAKTVGEAIAGSSGRGTTRDGRAKPEVAAPGVSITAPRSRNMTSPTPGALYTTMGGTSMASPHVTGSVALLFQCRGPMLTAPDAKYILESLTDRTGIAVTPDVAYGWGRLRVGNACAWAMLGPDVWLKTDASDTGVEPFVGPVFCEAPDIWVRPNCDGGLVHANPEHGQENHVHVIVRNRGTGPAYNTQVYLYWSDPSTNIPFAEWRKSSIRVGHEDTNVQVIPELANGAWTQTPVPFSWWPPETGSSIAGDSHFCLLVRIENEGDPSNVGMGGWDSVRNHNNIALLNVWIEDVAPDTSTSDSTCYVQAGPGQNSLWIDARALPEGTEVTLQFPLHALELRHYPALLKAAEPAKLRELAVCGDPVERKRLAVAVGGRLAGVRVPGDQLKKLGGIHGAKGLAFAGGTAHVELRGNMAFLERLNLVAHEKVPVRVHVRGLHLEPGKDFPLRIQQWVDGNPVGGYTTIFRRAKEERAKRPKAASPVVKLVAE